MNADHQYKLKAVLEICDKHTFIDILNSLEKLSIIESAEQRLTLREIRNLVTHEYSGNEKEMVDEMRRYIDGL